MANTTLVLLMLSCFAVVMFAKECSLNGVWYNELNSTMIINRTSEGGIFYGDYFTAVETQNGSAGQRPSKLVGYTSPDGANPTFGMTVVWKDGQSVTSWTGQCNVVDGQEKLTTMWILASGQNSTDLWKANMIGQDVFTRCMNGPCHAEDTRTPDDPAGGPEQNVLGDRSDL